MPPIVIAGGIAAAGAIASAKIASNAAKNAANTQTQSADKALALQKEMYQQTRSDLSPWLTQGQKAASALGTLMGLDAMPGSAPGGAATTVPLGGTRTPTARALYTGGRAVPREEAVLPPAYQTGGARTPTPQTAAQAQTASGYVQMRAPTGEIASVPSAQVNTLLARGATLIR